MRHDSADFQTEPYAKAQQIYANFSRLIADTRIQKPEAVKAMRQVDKLGPDLLWTLALLDTGGSP